MDALELARLAYREVHREFLEDLSGMTAGEFWSPPPGAQNHPGFLAWHVVRDEDYVIQRVVRGTEELWASERWDERLGIDTDAQGTGFTPGEAAALRYPIETFRQYCDRVFAATDAALAAASADLFDRSITWDGRASSMSMASQLHTGSVGHAWVHLGEMRAIRGLSGWRFRE